MGKHFIITPEINEVGREEIERRAKEKIEQVAQAAISHEERNRELMDAKDTLTHVYGRVIVKINIQSKNSHTFQNGLTIRRERQFNNFNRRETEPTNAVVISGEYIPSGSEILISHNALHDSNRIFNYKGNKENATDIRYYSIPEYECFAWRDIDGQLKPMRNFDFALRVFKPYEGHLTGLPHYEYKETLYVTTGKLKGKVVKTLKGCDYVIIYQDTNGREGNIIRFRPFGDPETKREEEAIAILDDLTDMVNNGNLLVGITERDCKKINEYYG